MRRVLMVVMVGLLCSSAARADVRSDQKSQVRFEGGLGRMVNLFGGRAARDGVVNTVAVKGDRKATMNGDRAQIIDLKEEKIYDVDLKDKSYRVTTFAEIRQQMEEARRKAAAQPPPAGEKPPAQTADGKEPQVEVDFNLKESGQTRTINGFDAREVVMTIAVREKGKKLEDSGGMVLTSNIWLAPKIAAMAEVDEFDKKYAQKLLGPALLDTQQMAAALAMYPMMKEAMARMQAEKVNMSGTAVLTVTRFEAVASKEQATSQQSSAKAEPREEPKPAGLGGLGGRLARRIAERNKDKDADKKDEAAAPAAAPADPNRATIMTMQQEVLKVTPTVADSDVTVPAGFKLKS